LPVALASADNFPGIAIVKTMCGTLRFFDH